MTDFTPPTTQEALARLTMPMADAMRTQRAVRRLHTDPVDHGLRVHPTAILTPHAAFYSDQSLQNLQRLASEEALRAGRGEKLFQDKCASCHSPDASGGDAPALKGNEFAVNWNDLSLADLYDRIRVSMPMDAPGPRSNQQVVDILLNSADGVGVASERVDSWTIHGGLNLHNAVSYGLSNLPPTANVGADRTVADNNRDGVELVTLDGAASSDSDGSIVSYEWREGSTSLGVAATVDAWLSVGVHTLTLEVTDDDGAIDTDTVIVTVSPANQVAVTATTPQASEANTVAGVFTITRSGEVSD